MSLSEGGENNKVNVSSPTAILADKGMEESEKHVSFELEVTGKSTLKM